MTPEEFRRIGHQLVDWIAEYRAGLEKRRVTSDVKPGQIRALMPSAPPRKPVGLTGFTSEIERVVMPGITHWGHPSFFAFFPSNTSLSSVLADLITAGLGANAMSWQTSPAATEIEEVVMDWLRQMVDLSTAWTGVVQDTASSSTLVALLSARERSTELSQQTTGFQSQRAPLVIYTSDQAHSSVEKAALLAGFGRENLRLVESDSRFAMSVPALKAALEADRAAGRGPCAIVATVGTTATTAMDPLEPISELAAAHQAWLHVDAAMAGSAMVLPECRPLWQGVERADSIVLNPHKWMGVGFDFSAYFVREPQRLVRVMSTDPSYLKGAHDAQVKNLRDWGIPLGRRFRALKLWMVLLDQGVEGIQARLRRDLENARWLEREVAKATHWRLVAPLSLQTICVRHEPPGLSGKALDEHNAAIARKVNESGLAYITPAVVKGQQILRISIGSELTEREHVAAAWALIQQVADGLRQN